MKPWWPHSRQFSLGRQTLLLCKRGQEWIDCIRVGILREAAVEGHEDKEDGVING
jgi:hypothetical protein